MIGFCLWHDAAADGWLNIPVADLACFCCCTVQTFKKLIKQSLGTLMTKINWTAHIIAHS